MKNKLFFVLLAGMILASVMMVEAADTVITATGTLTGENTYVLSSYWSAAPTSTNTKSVAYDSNYRYFVLINATSVGTSPKLNILAGNSPPGFRSSIGNLAVPLTVNRQIWVGPLSSARFCNSTKYFRFSTTNVTTATMAIMKVLR